MYMNDAMFEQYAKMMGKGKDPNKVDSPYVGTLDKGDPNVYTGYSRKNKYLVRLQVKIENNIIKDVKFKAFACNVVMLTMHMACEDIHNKQFAEMLKLKNEDYKERLKIPKDVIERDSVMVEEAVHSIINMITS